MPGWLNLNPDGSGIGTRRSTTIGVVCIDNIRCRFYRSENLLESESFCWSKAIRETITTLIQEDLFSIVIESDSQITIRAITVLFKHQA